MAQKRKITDYLALSTSSEQQQASNLAGEKEDSLEQSSSKRSKHRDCYDPEWADEFSWLRYIPPEDKDGPAMLCSLCQKHCMTTRRMVWISTPCKQLRKDKIREHEKSQCHINAVKAEVIAAASKESGGIRAHIEEQISLQKKAVMGAFKCLYWLAKEETAHHTKFSSMLELAKSLGCSYLSLLEVGRNASYTSHRMIDEFLLVLSECVEKDILTKVTTSPALGILCDESTDVSNIKQLVIFVRYLDQGKPNTAFLKMVDLFDGTARSIEKALLDVCNECGIHFSKVFSFGSDGASVMTGVRTGVATRLKQHNPEMISFHCGAHKLALASSQAAQYVPYLKTFDSNLVTLYYHFANSPVREAAFHEVQRVLDEPVLHLKKAVYTRWLSHDQAVTAIRRTLPSLLTTLEREVAEKDDAVAHRLVRALKSYNFVATLYLLSDVLPLLSKLSLVFQQKSIDLTVVKPLVTATITSLRELREQPGVFLKQLDTILAKLSMEFGLKTTQTEKDVFQEQIRKKYLDTLIENLENRFSESELLNAFITLFHPVNALKVKEKSSPRVRRCFHRHFGKKIYYSCGQAKAAARMGWIQAAAYYPICRFGAK